MSEGICARCGLGMLTTETCIEQQVQVNTGEYLDRILYGSEKGFDDLSDRCGDCNVIKGGLHHKYCDVEQCPKCEGQLISCDDFGDRPPAKKPKK